MGELINVMHTVKIPNFGMADVVIYLDALEIVEKLEEKVKQLQLEIKNLKEEKSN